LKGKDKRRFVGVVILWTCVVHTLFAIQMLYALNFGGLVASEWALAVFFPQLSLDATLPPEYPLDDKVIHTWKLIGKLLDALPASVLYGVIIALIWNSFYRLVQRARTQ